MNKKKFRANLYQACIASGMSDPALIQEHIKIAESFVFDNNKITVSIFRSLSEKISTSSDNSNGSRALSTHSGDYVYELTKEQRADAKIALKVIQQYQFTTLPELLHQITLVAHGDVNLTGSSSK